jgi:hypothetical protein
LLSSTTDKNVVWPCPIIGVMKSLNCSSVFINLSTNRLTIGEKIIEDDQNPFFHGMDYKVWLSLPILASIFSRWNTLGRLNSNANVHQLSSKRNNTISPTLEKYCSRLKKIFYLLWLLKVWFYIRWIKIVHACCRHNIYTAVNFVISVKGLRIWVHRKSKSDLNNFIFHFFFYVSPFAR